MPEEEPKPIGGKRIPEHLLKHTYRDPSKGMALRIAKPSWKPAVRDLVTTINRLRSKIPSEIPSVHEIYTLDQVTFKGRSNLRGELERALDRLVYKSMLDRTNRREFYDTVLKIRAEMSDKARLLLKSWDSLSTQVDFSDFKGHVEKLDGELSDLQHLVPTGSAEAMIFNGQLDAIRREVLRQANERLDLATGGIDVGEKPGEKNASLIGHLTETFNSAPSRVHTAARELWRQLADPDISRSERLSSEVKGTPYDKSLKAFLASAADPISECERALSGIISAQAKDPTGEKIDADPFTKMCEALALALEKKRDPSDPSRKTLSPRELDFADRYLREVDSVVAELLDAVPPRDWLDLPADVEQRLRQAIDKIRKLDASKAGSVERQLEEHPESLTIVWTEVSSSEIGKLKGDTELDRYRKQLQDAFGSKSNDLSGELKTLAASKDQERAEASAWRVARIVSDLMGELRSCKFTRQQRDAEIACARMEEALLAISAVVAQKVSSGLVRAT